MTLSDASARHLPSRPVNHTLEKRHVRCFQTLGMCRSGSWHWTHGWWELNKGFDTPNWSAGQAFLKYLGTTGQLPQVMTLVVLM